MKMTSCTLIWKDYGVYIRIDLDMIDKAEESDLLSVYSTAVLTAPLSVIFPVLLFAGL